MDKWIVALLMERGGLCWIGSGSLRLGGDHELNAIDQFPVAAFKSGDNSSGRSLQELFQASIIAAVRAVSASVRVKGDTIDVVPVFDRDASDKFAWIQRKGVAANVAVPAGSADFGKSAVICFEQY